MELVKRTVRLRPRPTVYSTLKLFSFIPLRVLHSPENSEFFITYGNDRAVLQYKVIDFTTIDLEHTVVPSSLRGKGVGKILAEAAFTYAKENNMKVRITCDFVQNYASKQLKPEWKNLLDKS